MIKIHLQSLGWCRSRYKYFLAGKEFCPKSSLGILVSYH